MSIAHLHPDDQDHLISLELQKLGLTDTESQLVISDRRGYITSQALRDRTPSQIADDIWSELVNPF